MCRVVNKYKSEYDVYIGRGSVWGNPFPMLNKSQEERERVIRAYRGWLWNKLRTGTITKEMLLALDGKRLACYCAPQACHGDVIVAAVKWAKGE